MSVKALEKKERQIISIFLFFPLLLLFLFGFLPIVNLVLYSFTSWNGISPEKEFIGLGNYIEILKNPKYFQVFLNSGYYFLSGTIQIVIALYFAVILSFKIRFKNFFKAVFVFPTLISGVAISMTFRMFFSPGGTFDYILRGIGLENLIQYWLGDPRFVNFTLGGISLWRHMGMSFVLYLGAIQTIPTEYYEIAKLEGANLWQLVRHVIIPNIQRVIEINFLLLTIKAISVFEIPLIMTNGSNSTMTFLLQTIQTAFEQRLIGLASAMAVIISVVIIFLTAIQRKLYPRA